MYDTTADTAITAKVATVPISINIAQLFGLPLTDVATYISIIIGVMVIVDYLWKWVRRYQTPVIKDDALLVTLEKDE